MEYDRSKRLEAQPEALSSLRLTVTNMERAQPTLTALKQAKNLQKLVLACHASDERVGLICRETLSHCPSLSELTLELAECSDEGTRHLAEFMRSSYNLRSLSLRLNNVGEKGAFELSRALRLSRLKQFAIYATQLDLHDRSIGDKGAAHFAEEISGSRELQSICIAQSGITNTGVQSLLAALETNSTITALHLQFNRIDRHGAGSLALFLTKTNSLRELVLDGNRDIGNSGTKELALALCRNDSLELLSLKSCGVGKLGAERFATTLCENSSLLELDLSGNEGIGNDALELIGRGLKRNHALEKLRLSSCEVSDEGSGYLADALQENSVLTELHLEKNEISDSGILALASTLASNK